METVSYKCPNCDGELKFFPEEQAFCCEYCLSKFTLPELEAQEQKDAQPHYAPPEAEQSKAAAEEGQAVLYSCPNCGAEIVTDETTAATTCFYCRNPVILSGRLDDAQKPDRMIPFTYQKEAAVTQFREWMRRKWFLPKSFHSETELQKITGVYFPYWMTDSDVSGRLDASAAKVSVWRSGDYEYTNTKYFSIRRGGRISFKELVKSALQKANRKLVEGVQPFDFGGVQPFSMPYLSGFQAEIRDVAQSDLMPELEKELHGYTENLLRETICGYTSVSVNNLDAEIDGAEWHYLMLPVWVLTFRSRKETGEDEIRYFAINGQTGKVCGKLPVCPVRLAFLFAAVTIPLFLILTMLGGLL